VPIHSVKVFPKACEFGGAIRGALSPAAVTGVTQRAVATIANINDITAAPGFVFMVDLPWT
jgi:hypothetical protein